MNNEEKKLLEQIADTQEAINHSNFLITGKINRPRYEAWLKMERMLWE